MVTQFDSKVSACPDVMIRHVGGESVALDLKTERYLGLDDVATRMWQALIDAESVEAAYTILAAEFDVDSEQLRRDLDDFIQRLLHLGLIKLGNKG